MGKQSRVLKEFRKKSGVEINSACFPDDHYIESTDYDMIVKKASEFGVPNAYKTLRNELNF